MLLLKLFLAFMQVGLFSVGGGYAAIPLIQEQIVNIHKLMTASPATPSQCTGSFETDYKIMK